MDRIDWLLCSLAYLLPRAMFEPVPQLHLMAFLPMTGPTWPGGPALLPALEMAVRDVNNRPDLLSGYSLNVIMKDTKCDAGEATNAMYELLYNPPVKLMSIGPRCSEEAEVQAQASHVWNITQFSYGATSPTLSDHTRFPRFFRVNPADTRFNVARLALIKHFKWNRVATINAALNIFSAVTDNFVSMARDSNVSIISQEIFNHDPTERVHNLKRKDARIIISSSYENSARLILCAAYKVGLYGSRIVWMFPGWYADTWWRVDLQDVPCTEEEMDTAAEGHIQTGFYYKNLKEERGVANKTISEFEAEFREQPNYKPEVSRYEFLNAATYDTVWGSALALNCAISEMSDQGFTKTLDEFEYSNGDIGDIITSCMYNISYLGLSGRVQFDRKGEPMKNIKIVQIRGSEQVKVGTYIKEEYPWYFEWIGEGIKWRGGVTPRDSTQITMIERTIPEPLYIMMTSLASVGILLAVSLFIFNVFYRNHVYVKLSSPNINNVLILGCILSYTTVYMYVSLEHAVLVCQVRHVLFTIGFTMSFGAMFSKTWRVYRIFCNKKLLRVKIHDFQLIAIVLVVLALMVTILVVWCLVDPFYIRTLELRSEMHSTGNDAIIIPFLHDCMSEYYYYFLLAICVVEGVLLAFGAFLAFETRKVKIQALNDSRHIGLCLYNIVVLCIVGFTLSLLLDHQVALLYGIVSGFVIIGTTLTLLLVFVPKIQSVFYPHTIDQVGPGTSEGNKMPDNLRANVNRNRLTPSTSFCQTN